MHKWDKRFLEMAKLVSTWSKDPSTQAGAVIVRPDKSVCSVGFNGFPRSMHDCDYHYDDRKEKLSRIIHAEMNAAMFAQDISLKGYTLYTYPFIPCNRCFVHMAQLGITIFVAPKATEDHLSRWGESFAQTHQFANECGIVIHEYTFT